eukprot:GHVU01170601.1.p3 GENE.GHVU01170601.1~~GHVU01170601.1.p3  ORF type:complete len:101 (-),score=9.11 GHVU01170601.1:1282-1584(-)
MTMTTQDNQAATQTTRPAVVNMPVVVKYVWLGCTHTHIHTHSHSRTRVQAQSNRNHRVERGNIADMMEEGYDMMDGGEEHGSKGSHGKLGWLTTGSGYRR